MIGCHYYVTVMGLLSHLSIPNQDVAVILLSFFVLAIPKSCCGHNFVCILSWQHQIKMSLSCPVYAPILGISNTNISIIVLSVCLVH